MAANSEFIYELDHCNFSYRGHLCLDQISLHLKPTCFYGLIGPNGSGKTTLISLLTGIHPPLSGKIQLLGKAIQSYQKPELARLLSLVPQSFSMEFEYTVFEVVLMGRHPFIGRFGSPAKNDIDLVHTALQTLDIHHLKDRYVTRLSGGERQRVLVARALAQDSDVLLLDEATANLDIRHSIDIMKTLRKKVNENGKTVIAAIHDLDLAAAFCDELIVMESGKIFTAGPVKSVLTSELLQQIFSVNAEIIHLESHSSHIQYRYEHEL